MPHEDASGDDRQMPYADASDDEGDERSIFSHGAELPPPPSGIPCVDDATRHDARSGKFDQV